MRKKSIAAIAALLLAGTPLYAQDTADQAAVTAAEPDADQGRMDGNDDTGISGWLGLLGLIGLLGLKRKKHEDNRIRGDATVR